MDGEPGPASTTSPSASRVDDANLATDSPDADGDSDAHALWAYKQRLRFLDDLIRNLDLLVYAEISVLYYLDTSLIRALFRAAIQGSYLTPKPSLPPQPPSPSIAAILGSNIICLVLNACFSAPAATEATRGYLHGSVLVDFVGQQGPTSKLRLLLLNLLITLLQLVALAATRKRRKVMLAHLGRRQPSTVPHPAVGEAFDLCDRDEAQTHDAEERGVLVRSASPLDERSALLDENSWSARSDPFALSDTLATGMAVVAELWIADTVREQYMAYEQQAQAGRGVSASLRARLRQRVREIGAPIRE
ncbi:DUF1746-domain-containing protein [Trichodelitschia bisporula]|uniref:DUF1746-domain-containing protein n=1 Tax=Trichodelitschia bisporula TaxID=703511 RepID=A0A6G1I3M9_9PEZI|nr:DUF1746-domain-containing protein [Trichodelitschia bisporula]